MDLNVKIVLMYIKKKYSKTNNTSLNYYYKNKEICKTRCKNYSKNNRTLRNNIQRKWRKKIRKDNPSYKCWENARKRIWKILNIRKQTNTNKLI